jgi:hypothetical protein
VLSLLYLNSAELCDERELVGDGSVTAIGELLELSNFEPASPTAAPLGSNNPGDNREQEILATDFTNKS